MAEFYDTGHERSGGSWPSSSRDEAPKKSALELALDELQNQTLSLLREALSLAKSGDPHVQDEIEKKIEMYKRMAPVTPDGLQEERIAEIRKHQEYQRKLTEFEKQLKKEIFG